MTDGTVTSGEMTSRALRKRAGCLFLNFFLIILAYYQVKSASRSLLIEYWGSDNFPYVWIASALVLAALIGFYNRLVERHDRLNVVLGCCLLFMLVLVAFRLLLVYESAAAAVGFYVFVDIFSVVLVEQFWSLANTITKTEEGKRSYWFVGTGGLIGGMLGGALAAALTKFTPMQTPDLLLSCAGFLSLIFVLNLRMGRMGLYEEIQSERAPVVAAGDWRTLLENRYLLLIAATLLCAQLAQPLVEFQFIKIIETRYTDLDDRTAFIATFFSVLGFVSIAINVAITPVIHRYLGVIAGMLAQPLVLAAFSFGYMLHPTLMAVSALKISDRGLSYSINRASKELLYIPVDPIHTYQAKAWIDMLGYRLFKISGSVLILLLTQWLPFSLDVVQLGWITLIVCTAWTGAITMLSREYNAYVLQPASA